MAGGNTYDTVMLENSLAVSYRTEIDAITSLLYRATLGMDRGEREHSDKNPYLNIHSSVVCKSPKLETIHQYPSAGVVTQWLSRPPCETHWPQNGMSYTHLNSDGA